MRTGRAEGTAFELDLDAFAALPIGIGRVERKMQFLCGKRAQAASIRRRPARIASARSCTSAG